MGLTLPNHIQADLERDTTNYEYFVVLNSDGINAPNNAEVGFPIFVGSSNFFLDIPEYGQDSIRVRDYNLRIDKIQESVNLKTKKVKISNCNLTLTNFKVNNTRLCDVIEESVPTQSSSSGGGTMLSFIRSAFKVYLKTPSCKSLSDCLQVGYFKVARYTYDEKQLRIEGMDDWLPTFFINLPKAITNVTGDELVSIATEEMTLDLYKGKYIPILYGKLQSAPAVVYLDDISDTTDYFADNKIKVLADDAYIRGNSRKSWGIVQNDSTHPHAESYATNWSINDPRTSRMKDNSDSLQIGLGNSKVNIPDLPHYKNNEDIKNLWNYPQYLVGTRHPTSNYAQSNPNTEYHYDHITLMTWWWKDTKIQEGVMWCSNISELLNYSTYFASFAYVPETSNTSNEKEYFGVGEGEMYKASEDLDVSPYFRFDNNYLGLSRTFYNPVGFNPTQSYTNSYLRNFCRMYNNSNRNDTDLPFSQDEIMNNGDEWGSSGSDVNGYAWAKTEWQMEVFQFKNLNADVQIWSEYTYETGETVYPEDLRLFGRHRFTMEDQGTAGQGKWTDLCFLPFKPVIDYNVIDSDMYQVGDTTIFPPGLWAQDFGFGASPAYELISEGVLTEFPLRNRFAGFKDRDTYGITIRENLISNCLSHFYPNAEDSRNTFQTQLGTFSDELDQLYNPGVKGDTISGFYMVEYNDNTNTNASASDSDTEDFGAISQWYGIGLDRTWAQSQIFNYPFYCNAVGKLSQEEDKHKEDNFTDPVRWKGVVYLPFTYEHMGAVDWGASEIESQLPTHQTTFSERDNWSFWILYTLLANNRERVANNGYTNQLMIWGRDSLGGLGGDSSMINDLFYTYGMDFYQGDTLTYNGNREFYFYNIRLLDIIKSDLPAQGHETDNKIEPPVYSSSSTNSNETFFTQATFNSHIGIKFTADLVTEAVPFEGDDASVPPFDIHHMSSYVADYYGHENVPGGSAIWDIKLGYGRIVRQMDGEHAGEIKQITRWMGAQPGGYGAAGIGISSGDGLSVKEFNWYNYHQWTAGVDPDWENTLNIGGGAYSLYWYNFGGAFIRELSRGGWQSNGGTVWNRKKAYKILENPVEVMYDILTQELGYTGTYQSDMNYNRAIRKNQNINLAFSIHESQSSKDIIEEIARHSTVIPHFRASDGTFRMIDVTWENVLNTGHVQHELIFDNFLSYKISKTPIEDICLSVIAKYGYNYHTGEYDKTYTVKNDIMSEYVAYYNLDDPDSHTVELELPYVQDELSAWEIASFYLELNKNQKTLIEFTVPLSKGLEYEIGDTVKFVEGNSKDVMKFYGKDFIAESQYYVMDQYLKTKFRITSVTKKRDIVSVKAEQVCIVKTEIERYTNPYMKSQAIWVWPEGLHQPDYGIGAWSSDMIPDPEEYLGIEPEIYGCTNSDAINYNPDATVDDGSCVMPGGDDIAGCTNPAATNYDPEATIDDGSCEFILGDFGLDGAVDILDIVAIVNLIIGNTEEGDYLPGQLVAGDFNQDGGIDVLDVVAIVNLVLGN